MLSNKYKGKVNIINFIICLWISLKSFLTASGYVKILY